MAPLLKFAIADNPQIDRNPDDKARSAAAPAISYAARNSSERNPISGPRRRRYRSPSIGSARIVVVESLDARSMSCGFRARDTARVNARMSRRYVIVARGEELSRTRETSEREILRVLLYYHSSYRVLHPRCTQSGQIRCGVSRVYHNCVLPSRPLHTLRIYRTEGESM